MGRKTKKEIEQDILSRNREKIIPVMSIPQADFIWDGLVWRCIPTGYITAEIHITPKVVDCNECMYLNITESDQRKFHDKHGILPNHICSKYNQRVLHLGEDVKLNACKQCKENNHKHFIRREIK